VKLYKNLILAALAALAASGCKGSGASVEAVEAELRVCNSKLVSSEGNDEAYASFHDCLFSIDYYADITPEEAAECYLYSQYLSVEDHLAYARPDLPTPYAEENFEKWEKIAEKADIEKEFWSMIHDRQHDHPRDSLLKKQSFVAKIIVGLGGDSDGSISSLDPEEAAPKAYKKYKRCTPFSEPLYKVMVLESDQ